MKTIIPADKSGDWKVEKFSINKEQAEWSNIRANISQGGKYADRTVKPGQYTALINRGLIVMSDTPAEINDFIFYARRASGHVLVTGLGLGLFVQALFDNEKVKSITVIETSQDVLNLVACHLEKRKNCIDFEIIHADAFSWNPKERKKKLGIEKFDMAWHDIWNEICRTNLKEMKKLRKKYAPHVTKGKQHCWCEVECMR